MRKSLLLLLVCAAILSLCACGQQPDALLDTGLESFVAGRTETPPYMPKNVIDLLDEMLEQYSGGVYLPSGTEVSSSDASLHPDTGGHTEGDPLIASNKTVLEQIIRQAICDTEESVSIELKGFTVSYKDIERMIENVMYTEMIRYMCVTSYTVYVPTVYTGDQTIEIGFDYSLPVDDIKQMKVRAAEAAQKTADDLGLAGMTDIEAVKAVNEYLCDHCEYPPEPYAPEVYTAYGAFIDGVCVCDGYTRAAQALFELCGVESRYIHGATAGGLHAWSLVKVDGKWYHLDITWNDAGTLRTDYFLVTDDYMRVSRNWDRSEYPSTPSSNYAA